MIYIGQTLYKKSEYLEGVDISAPKKCDKYDVRLVDSKQKCGYLLSTN